MFRCFQATSWDFRAPSRSCFPVETDWVDLPSYCKPFPRTRDEAQEAAEETLQAPCPLAACFPGTFHEVLCRWTRDPSRNKTMSSGGELAVSSENTWKHEQEKNPCAQIPVSSSNSWTFCNIIYAGNDHLKPQSSIMFTSRGLELESLSLSHNKVMFNYCSSRRGHHLAHCRVLMRACILGIWKSSYLFFDLGFTLSSLE